MSSLSEIEQQVWELVNDKGYTLAEVSAQIEGRSYNAVRHAWRRAKKKMQMGDQSPGIMRALEEMGLDLTDVEGGWLKSREASLRFNIKDKDQDEATDFVDLVTEAFSERLPRVEKAAPPAHVSRDLLTKYILTDLHMGMKSLFEETGDKWDIETAEKTLYATIDELIASTPNSHTALLLNLGDFFHANDSKNMTPGSGHILDMDGKFAQIAQAGVRAIRYCIDQLLRKHEKVIYGNIPGNHDVDQAHWLGIAVGLAYEREPRLDILYTPSHWFKMEWGRNLIVGHHGDKVNFQRLVLAMAENFSEEWGKAYWRFLDSGHIHHDNEREIGGCLVRTYRTLAGKDSYASSSAYTSKRGLVAHTLHKTRGEIGSHKVNLYQGEVAA